jgi:hypothetical protein
MPQNYVLLSELDKYQRKKNDNFWGCSMLTLNDYNGEPQKLLLPAPIYNPVITKQRIIQLI